jgi:hypothetical protein
MSARLRDLVGNVESAATYLVGVSFFIAALDAGHPGTAFQTISTSTATSPHSRKILYG